MYELLSLYWTKLPIQMALVTAGEVDMEDLFEGFTLFILLKINTNTCYSENLKTKLIRDGNSWYLYDLRNIPLYILVYVWIGHQTAWLSMDHIQNIEKYSRIENWHCIYMIKIILSWISYWYFYTQHIYCRYCFTNPTIYKTIHLNWHITKINI
jgi:uncharacterized membrane-anchored protein YitT (DUF2179 family)